MSSVVTRSAHVLVALAVGATMLVSATSPAAAAEVADQVSDLGPSGGGQSAWFWNKQTVAQPFTAGATGALTAVTVSIGNDSPGTSTGFTVGVYATASNKPTGAALAEVPFGEAAAKALGAGRTPTTVTARFDAPPIVTAGTTYAIVLSTPDTHVYHWFVGKYTTFNYSLYGNQINSPGTWHEFSPYPMTFSTFVDATFTPGKPSAPSSLAATPENGSASIAFTPGSSNGSAITNYEYRIGGAGGTWTALSPADKTSPVNIPGLVNGTATSIELRAVNALGESPASDAVTVTPRTTPSAPTSLTATAADASASIAFVAGADGEQAREQVEAMDPDIALLDIALGDGPSGVHLAHALQRTRPDIGLLMLTQHADARSASKEGLELPAGVGFLRKHLVNDMGTLLEAIDLVLADRGDQVRQDHHVEPGELPTSGRDLRVLELMALGYGNTEIAAQFHVSVKSIERWLEHIYRSMGIETRGTLNPRVEAVRHYIRLKGLPERL